MKIQVQNHAGTVVTTREFPSSKETIAIGRSAENDVVVQAPEMSPKHFSLQRTGQGYELRDHDSVNGVFVDGRRVQHGKVTQLSRIEAGGFTFVLSDTGEPAAAPARDPLKRVMAAVLAVCVALLAVWAIRARRAAPPLGGDDASDATSEYAQRQAKGRQLYRQAQEQYFRNNLVEAAALFSQALDLDPDNQNARDFLEEIRYETVGGIVALAFKNLAANDLSSADRNIGQLRQLDPDNKKLAELVLLREGQSRFEQAKGLFGGGKYEEARNILQSIRIVDDGLRLQWLAEVNAKLDFQRQYREADAQLGAGNTAQAATEFDTLRRGLDPDSTLNRTLADKTSLADRVDAFNRALQGKRYAEAIRQGRWLEAHMSPEDYPVLYRKISGQMDDLHRLLAPLQTNLASQASASMQAADEKLQAGDERAAYGLYRETIDRLAQADFAAPSPAGSSRIRDLSEKLNLYVKKMFQQGYIYVSAGSYDDATACFQTVIDLADPDEDYYLKARQQLDRLHPPKPL